MPTDPLQPIKAKVDKVANLGMAELQPLGYELEKVVVEDNRRGVLAGLDKDGNPLAPTTYRGSLAGKARARAAGKGFGTVNTPAFKGFDGGAGPILANGNLTAAEYKRLDGPPLAPRRERSRVITNLRTRHQWDGQTLQVQGAWLDVVSAKGVPFLAAHFEGLATGRGRRTKLPIRDLRGVRPWGRQRAREVVRAWVRWLLGDTAAPPAP